MNEKRIDLFKQASAEAYLLCKEKGYAVGELDSVWVAILADKLSELVVQECMQVCAAQRDPQNLNYKPSEAFAQAIGTHFGVF